MLQIKRVYSAPEHSDGFRVLIDRLWPRGLKRETACIDCWRKEIAPSPQLRAWFHHEPKRFGLFRAAYWAELDRNPAARSFADDCRCRLGAGNVTLLFAAKDMACNHAVVLKEWLGG